MSRAQALNRFINDTEQQIFFNSFSPSEFKHQIIFLLMAYAGLRVNEAVRVNVEDFLSSDYSMFKVVNTKVANKSKGKPARVEPVIIPLWLARMLKDYVIKYNHKIKRGYLFFGDGHGCKNPHISKAAVGMFLSRKRRKLGGSFKDVVRRVQYRSGRIQDHHRIGTHSFRRWFVTNFYKESGNDIKATSQAARHFDMETTQVYIDGFQFFDKAPRIINKLKNPFIEGSLLIET